MEHRELIETVGRIVRSVQPESGTPAIERLADAVTGAVGGEMGFTGGRLYRRGDHDYSVHSTFGAAERSAIGTRVPLDYPPVVVLERQGTIYVEPDDELIDPELESRLGTRGFAACIVGEDERYMLAFDLAPTHDRDTVLLSLELLRNSLSDRLHQQKIRDVYLEARKIQASILPASAPSFGPFDIAGAQIPLDQVGGDFYDYIPLSDKILGLAIADVAGHGLPAALQVRDIYMGLRMATGRDFKIVRTVERLNQIIHTSTSTGRFVAMFYGELEIDGTFIYVNAGHPAPIHVTRDGTVTQLEAGGAVLGPIPTSSYQRGYLMLRPGDVMVACTDGILETRPQGRGWEAEDWETARLVPLVLENRDLAAEELVRRILSDVESWSGGAEPTDDRTVAVVRYPED